MRWRQRPSTFVVRFISPYEDHMIDRSIIKLGISGALLLIIIGVFSACAELPTDPTDKPANECVWIDGTIHRTAI
jgi:hypothetical protein